MILPLKRKKSQINSEIIPIKYINKMILNEFTNLKINLMIYICLLILKIIGIKVILLLIIYILYIYYCFTKGFMRNLNQKNFPKFQRTKERNPKKIKGIRNLCLL